MHMRQRVTAVIDTIDYVSGIGNYVIIASHDHYGSEAGGECIRLKVRTQLVSCLPIQSIPSLQFGAEMFILTR